MLTTLILFLLATYGTTNIIGSGKIFSSLRTYIANHHDLDQVSIVINCPMCLGWWVGLFWCLIGLYPSGQISWPIEWLAAACVGSAFCWIVRVILSRLGEDSL